MDRNLEAEVVIRGLFYQKGAILFGERERFMSNGMEGLQADEARVAIWRVQSPVRAVSWTRLWSETNPHAMIRNKLSRGCEHLWTERAGIGNPAPVDELWLCRVRAKTKVGRAGVERWLAATKAKEL
jgi:hypothetical protein